MNNYTHLYNVNTTSIHEAWVSWLKQFPWAWFLTLTFKEPIHPEQANKRYLRYVREFNRSLYGRRYDRYNLGIINTKSIEYQKREVLHFHGLWGAADRDLTLVNHFEWSERWNTSGNGFARIYPYSDDHAVWYVTKYVAKRGDIDIWIPKGFQESLSQKSLAV